MISSVHTMSELLGNSSKQSEWVTFKYAEIKISNIDNSQFALLRVADNFTDYGRIDQKFFPLVEKQLEDLRKGIFTQLYCYPDSHKGPGNWRLDDIYYKTLQAESSRISLEQTENLPTEHTFTSKKDRVTLTFTIDKADHALVTALHAQIKNVSTNLSTFESFNSYLYTLHLDTLRFTHTELNSKFPKIPF